MLRKAIKKLLNINFIMNKYTLEASMKENLCSIPINDIFKGYHDCPLCFMRDMLEEKLTEYITGAAMMEPDVRVKTNALGFCKTHFDKVIEKGNRLSVALILQTLLAQVDAELVNTENSLKKQQESVKKRRESCFVCENLERNMVHLISCLISLFETDEEFKKVYKAQKGICTYHYGELVLNTNKKNKEFLNESKILAQRQMNKARADIDEFCSLFDYRNKQTASENAKTAIEKAVENLSGRKLI